MKLTLYTLNQGNCFDIWIFWQSFGYKSSFLSLKDSTSQFKKIQIEFQDFLLFPIFTFDLNSRNYYICYYNVLHIKNGVVRSEEYY